MTKPFAVIVEHKADGTQRVAARLTVDEYLELERAMQWPEDLEKWDRLNTPTYAGLDGVMWQPGAKK